jgi:DNA (cytosine-5)-methyltransferase 1
MRFVSLFAGVGGFDLGLEMAGHECLGQVEIDKHCQKVLAKHWPDIPRHDDVRTAIDWAHRVGLVGRTDLVCGGFPCQDVSVAGKRAGLAGERTGLFWDALAFAEAVEAKWILLENVPGLLTSNQGRDFGTVLTALADAGYVYAEWRLLDSQFFGVPQRRRRVFLVAGVGEPSRRPLLVEPEGSEWHPPQGGASRQGAAVAIEGGVASVDFRHGTLSNELVPTLQAKNQGGYSLNYTPGVVAFSHNQGIDIQPSTENFPTLRAGGVG